MDHPFWEKLRSYRSARAEFARFVLTEEKSLLEIFKKLDRGEVLEKWYRFYSHAPRDVGKIPFINQFSSTLEISAGLGITGRYNNEGKWIKEYGLSLVYSFGFTGDVAVILYPFKGDDNNWRQKEDNILLAVVPANVISLRKRMNSDIKYLIDYGYVTSIHCKPNFIQKMRIKWIRFYCAKNVDNKWENSKKTDLTYKALSSAGSGSFAGIFKYSWPILLAYLLVKCG